MPTITTIDPVTRLEGHLKIQVTIDMVNGVQQVVDAKATGTLFRGFENILVNRHPFDAQHITQRICGVCTTVHAIASIRAVEDALDIQIPANANLIRNLILGYAAIIIGFGAITFVLTNPQFLDAKGGLLGGGNIYGIAEAKDDLDQAVVVVDPTAGREFLALRSSGWRALMPLKWSAGKAAPSRGGKVEDFGPFRVAGVFHELRVGRANAYEGGSVPSAVFVEIFGQERLAPIRGLLAGGERGVMLGPGLVGDGGGEGAARPPAWERIH